MIVEFIEDDNFMLAWVLEEKSHRLAVYAENKKEMNIAKTRILNSFEMDVPSQKEEQNSILQKIAQTCNNLATKINLQELWEILEGEGESFSFETLAQLYWAKEYSKHEYSALLRAIFKDALLFKFTINAAFRVSLEEQEKLLIIKKEKEEKENLSKEAIVWLTAIKNNKMAYEPEGGEKIRKLLSNFAVYGEDAADKVFIKEILKKAGYKGTSLDAFHILVYLGDFNKHENIEIKRLGLKTEFTEDILNEAEVISLNSNFLKEKRLDLTAEETITIDTADAKDLDDALSVKKLANGNWQLMVHVSDVAGLIKKDSPLALEARNRSSSIYLPEIKHAMLPETLSGNFLSLTLNEVKPAFSFIIEIDELGTIVQKNISPSLIKVKKQYSFSEADQNIETDEFLGNLLVVSELLEKYRLENGASIINLPKLNVYFNMDATLNINLATWDTPAKNMLSEFMILANFLAAKTLFQAAYPCPYRYQEKPGNFKNKNFTAETENEKLALKLQTRRLTGRGGLSLEASKHHGLGLNYYTSFTAPLRRYIDFLVAGQLRNLVLENEPLYSKEEMFALVMPAFEAQGQIQRMQNRRIRYWLAVYLKEKVGSVYKAIVFDQFDRCVRLCVPEFMLEFDLFLSKNAPVEYFKLGEEIDLRLATVLPLEDVFKFDWA